MTSTPIDGTTAPSPSTPRSAPLIVISQYLKDLSFENPNAPDVLTAGNEAPRGSVQVDVLQAQKGPGVYEVSLRLRVEATTRQDKLAYLIDVDYCGLFQVGDLPAETVEPLIMIDAPRLLFPFARAVIASAVSEGGFPRLIVGPIDFAALYRQKRQVERSQAIAAAPG